MTVAAGTHNLTALAFHPETGGSRYGVYTGERRSLSAPGFEALRISPRAIENLLSEYVTDGEEETKA